MSDQNSWGGVIAAIARSAGAGLQASAGMQPTPQLQYRPLPKPRTTVDRGWDEVPHPDEEPDEPIDHKNSIAFKTRLMEDIPLRGDMSRWYRR